MRIKRKFQGFIPAGKILDMFSKSKADTYSCNKINDIAHPIGSLYTSVDNINPSETIGGEWELVRTYSGGDLLAVASVSSTGGSIVYNGSYVEFSSNAFGATKTYNVQNFIPNILNGYAGTILVKPQNIVGYVEADMYVSGYGGSGTRGLWWSGNYNDLPSGVELMSGAGHLTGGIHDANYGGCTNKYMYKVSGDTEFFVNPKYSPYNGPVTAGNGGTICFLNVRAYAKPGTTYLWKRVS